MEADVVGGAYRRLCEWWRSLDLEEKQVFLDRFAVLYSFNSGSIENPEITYHDTSEVFDKNGVSGFTGDVRTIYEINNLKNAWAWLLRTVNEGHPLTTDMLLDAHRVLTVGTYDERRWANGERPGTFKVHDYRVASDVGLEPGEVPTAIDELLDEIDGALDELVSLSDALTIASYAHARLVSIHPFADGNGRMARLLMNLVFMRTGNPPCSISAEDRMSYFGALDAFDVDGDLSPFERFCAVQSIKTWLELHPEISCQLLG